MNFYKEFGLLLRACYPLIYVPTVEEERLEKAIATVGQKVGDRNIYVWDFVTGYQNNPNFQNVGKRNPLQALEFITDKLPERAEGIFILRDFHRFLEDVAVSRQLRNLARLLKSQPKNVVIVAPQIQIPAELTEVLTVVDFPLPTTPEIRTEIQRLTGAIAPTPEPLLDELVRAARGLSLERIRRVLTMAIATNGRLEPEAAELILEEKRQSIRQTQILDFYPATEQISDIGGLDNLKDWLLRRGGAFSERARAYGLPNPRGLLLVGIQGTGKSLTAKAIAHHWHLPLLRLDVGRLFGGLVGESESRTRQTVELAEALSPCILWIDEIDKGFSGVDGKGDSGTTSRVFGTFITWLAEKQSPVFVVATANNIRALPPEMLRKGRFDEVFFVGLPSREEREAIFKVHLDRLRPHNLGSYDLKRLAYETPDFSGAEIEQTIIEAMHIGFSQNRDFVTDDILEAASQIIPLAKTAQEEIEFMQKWVAAGKARLASKNNSLSDRLQNHLS